MRAKVKRQCPQTTQPLKRAEAESNRGSSGYQPNALPPGQADSRTRHGCIYIYTHIYIHTYIHTHPLNRYRSKTYPLVWVHSRLQALIYDILPAGGSVLENDTWNVCPVKAQSVLSCSWFKQNFIHSSCSCLFVFVLPCKTQ